MNYNRNLWRINPHRTWLSRVRHFVQLLQMTSDYPIIPFRRNKNAYLTNFGGKNNREISRFCWVLLASASVTFCQDESATSHSYDAMTKGLILVTTVGSRKKSSLIKVAFR